MQLIYRYQIARVPRQDADLLALLLHPGAHLQGPVTPPLCPILASSSLFQVNSGRNSNSEAGLILIVSRLLLSTGWQATGMVAGDRVGKPAASPVGPSPTMGRLLCLSTCRSKVDSLYCL